MGHHQIPADARMEEPLITVCIPTFNRLELLKRCLKSVTDQNMQQVIIRVSDNASTDETESYMRQMASSRPDIFYVRNAENCGVLENIRRVTSSATTPFFIPLADDDWLLPGSLRFLLDHMTADPSLGAVVSQTTRINSVNGERWTNPNRESWEFRRYARGEIIAGITTKGHFEWSSVLFSTKACQEIGGYRPEVGLPADLDLQLRLFWNFPVKLVERECAVWNLHPGQTVQTLPSPKAACSALKMLYGAIPEEEIKAGGQETIHGINALRRKLLGRIGRQAGRALTLDSAMTLSTALGEAKVPASGRALAFTGFVIGLAVGIRDRLSATEGKKPA